jgi:magnesium chelatase family protein
MLVKTKGSALIGMDATTITIEVNVSMGQGYCIVGLPDNAVKESLHRTESAIKANGYHMPRTKVVVNLSPADLKKTGAAFDLPIAVGLLAASEQLTHPEILSQYIIMGELGLDGLLYPIKGVLSMAIQAKAEGYAGIIIPYQNTEEAKIVAQLPIHGFEHIAQVVAFLNNPHIEYETPSYIPPHANQKSIAVKGSALIQPPDFEQIKGQLHAKRALTIASAGGHNMIMIGPPGAGKTLLAKSIVSILPPLTQLEALETTQVYSAMGKLNGIQLFTQRPFRHPHHTLSEIAMIGGGSNPQPGEISMAHNGVLFLDELPEFSRNVMEVLRQPMEEGLVCIARAKTSVQFPARFMLIASMNPCPCGYYNHPTKQCHCTSTAIQKYLFKISGPLLDRIDLHIEVAPIQYDTLRSAIPTENSASVRLRVQNARQIQSQRFEKEAGIYTNAQMSSHQLELYCKIEADGSLLLKNAMEKFQLSARGLDRIIKVARTIADLASSQNIQLNHISEAIGFRTLDRSSWGKYKP